MACISHRRDKLQNKNAPPDIGGERALLVKLRPFLSVGEGLASPAWYGTTFQMTNVGTALLGGPLGAPIPNTQTKPGGKPGAVKASGSSRRR